MMLTSYAWSSFNHALALCRAPYHSLPRLALRIPPMVDEYCDPGIVGATAHGHELPIEPLEDPTEIAHLPQMLVQFTEELAKHASYRPRLCTPGNVRREGDSARHHIQFFRLESLEKCPGIVLNSGVLPASVRDTCVFIP